MRKHQTSITLVTTTIIVLMLLSFIPYIYSHNVSALTYSNNVDLEYTFAPTLDVSFSSNAGFVIEDLTPGTAADSNIVTVTASSNSSDGFTLVATAGKSSDSYRNNNRLVHSNNANYFESIATNADTTLDNLGTNKWGYSVCTAVTNNTCSTWSNYNGLPAVGNTGTELAETSSAGSTSVDMKIGASSTNTQVSGTFTNDINFTITAKVVTYDYAITYDGNGSGDTVSNVPINASGSLQTGQTLLTSNQTPIRAKYYFLGWCSGTVDTTINGTLSDPVCNNGRVYQTNDYIKIADAVASNSEHTAINNVVLNAMWGSLYMQDFTLASCESMATDKPIILYDKRATFGNNNYEEGDEGDYTVRYINGGCWMTQNLRIQGTISSEYSNFEGNDFNVSEYDFENSTDECTSPNGYSNACSHIPSSTNITAINSANTNIQVTGKIIGAWYNFFATSAGTISGISNKDATSNDICPNGWHLPSGPSDKTDRDFNKLVGNTLDGWQAPTAGLISFNATPGGIYYSGQNQLIGSSMGYGYWWSASPTYTTLGSRYYFLYSNESNTFLGHGALSRTNGFFVRCVRTS